MIESQYIAQKLAQYGQVTLANNYTQFILDNGGRLCNDGYPDARNPLTNSFSVRMSIARYRQEWKRAYPHVCYVRNSEAKRSREYKQGHAMGYSKALDDVANSLYIEPTIPTSERIANLRKLFNKET